VYTANTDLLMECGIVFAVYY